MWFPGFYFLIHLSENANLTIVRFRQENTLVGVEESGRLCNT